MARIHCFGSISIKSFANDGTHLPELGTNLVTALSGLNMNDFSHLDDVGMSLWGLSCFTSVAAAVFGNNNNKKVEGQRRCDKTVLRVNQAFDRPPGVHPELTRRHGRIARCPKI